MNYLVTGSAGFIGSHVSRALLERGDAVVGVDNFNDYYDPTRKRSNVRRLEQFELFQMVESDVRNKEAMRELFEAQAFDAVIHLAAMAGVRNSIVEPALYFDVNFNGMQTILEFARIHGVNQIVMASTSSTYGNTNTIPFIESDPCINPLQPYATSKRSAELMGKTYHQHYGINFTSTRFFTVYGPAGRPDMMPFLLAESILNGKEVPLYEGAFERDWTYIDDIVAGVVAAADRPLGFEVINLGRGAPESLTNFISIMESVAGQKANLALQTAPPTEMLRTFADTTKAQRLLDFNPRVSLDEGVERFWDWFVKQPQAAISRKQPAVPYINMQIGSGADSATVP